MPNTVPAAPAEPSLADFDFKHVDPTTLILKKNVRIDTKKSVDAEFVDSIRRHGVLQPIVAYETDEGLAVYMGHRRTLGAIAAGRPLIPCYIMPAPDDDVVRLWAQLEENAWRADLTTADKADSFNQLVAFGVPASEIVKRNRGATEKDVAAAVKIAGSKAASAVAAKFEFLTLDVAAVIADFEPGADKDGIARIVKAASEGGNVSWAIREAEADRKARKQTASHTAKLTKAGVRIIPSDKVNRYENDLDYWVDDTGTVLTPETHKDCPGHAAFLPRYHGGTIEIVYICADPQKNKHNRRWPTSSSTKAKPTKAERAETISNNKAMATATKIRRAWLREFLARKTAPASAAQMIARCITHRGERQFSYARDRSNRLAHELFGLPVPDGYYRGNLEVLVNEVSDARAQVIALGVVLAAYETCMDKSAWRDAWDGTGAYLDYIAGEGYPLTPIEVMARDVGRKKEQSLERGAAEDAAPVDADEVEQDSAAEGES